MLPGLGRIMTEKQELGMIRIPKEKANYTYLLRCSDGSFYTGWTNQLERRLRVHNSGKGGKYTRSRRPVELVYYECYPTRQEAMSREWHIKQLTHEQKAALIEKIN